MWLPHLLDSAGSPLMVFVFLAIFLNCFLWKKPGCLSWGVFLSLILLIASPWCHFICPFVSCNFCKLVVRLRSLIDLYVDVYSLKARACVCISIYIHLSICIRVGLYLPFPQTGARGWGGQASCLKSQAGKGQGSRSSTRTASSFPCKCLGFRDE